MSKNRLFVLVLALASFSVAAQAQMYSSSDYTFRGFYVGGNVGGAITHARTNFTGLPDTATFFNLAPSSVTPESTGFLGGGQAGWNWIGDNNRLLFGVEGDFQGAGNLKGTTTVSPILRSDGVAQPGTSLMAQEEMPWFATLRARIGWVPTDRFLIYTTGGLAYAHIKWAGTADLTAATGFIYPSAADDNKAGWTAGGGFEYLAAHHVSLGGEYLYYNLGDIRLISSGSPANIACPTCQVQFVVNPTGHIVRGKVNFKF